MRKHFITATETIPLIDLLTKNLPDGTDPISVITSGGVWKDQKNRFTNPKAIIKKNQTVKVYFDSHQGISYEIPDTDIVFENEDFLVVHKPSPLNVHAVPANLYYNLNHGIFGYLKKQGLNYATNPVSRLDKCVEGLVLFGKNKTSERDLFKLMREHRVGKWYLGLLDGGDQKSCTRIIDHLINDGKRTSNSSEGKLSESIFVPKEPLGKFPLFSIFIRSGRRHQIRFHASITFAPLSATPSTGQNTVSNLIR